MAAARALSAEEPERAYEHAKVARRFAGRIGVVREATGIAAYHAGQYAEALGDLRAARRMTGSDEFLPIMADCERGLGRPERALDLVRTREAERLDRAGRIELAIVESGARRDLGQHDAAVITLQRVPELRDPQPRPWSARLAFAYADALADAGHEEAATDWFARAMAFDEDGETDAADRYAELTGGLIEDLEEDDDEFGIEGGDILDDLPEDDAIREKVQAEADETVLPEAEASSGEVVQGSEPAEVGLAADGPAEDGAVEDGPVEDGAVEDGPVEDGAVAASEPTADGVSAEAADDDGPAAGEAPVPATSPVVEAANQATEAPGAEAPSQASVKESAPSFGPAFIEPNFGDVLDDPEEPEDRVKHQS